MITKPDDLLKLIKGGKLDRYDVEKLKKEYEEDKRNGRSKISARKSC